MPLPHHIIGSMSRSEDKTTGLVSYFQIIEKLTLTGIGPLPVKLSADMAPTIFVTASWIRPPDEEASVLLDSEWWIEYPGKLLPEFIHEHKFQIDELFGRLSLNLGLGLSTQPTAGVASIENRIRISGSDSRWQVQRFSFWLEYTIIAPNESEPNQGN